MSKLAVCAIMKDEARYILEWVAYYIAIGADYFLIYDNGSTDGSAELLERLSRHIPLTVEPWPSPTCLHQVSFAEVYDGLNRLDTARNTDWRALIWMSPQIAAYNHALTTYGDNFDWMLFADADEFLVPVRHATIKEFIAHAAARDEVTAIAVNEKYFGSSGHEAYEAQPVLDRFRRCALPFFDGHLHVKSLVRPQAVATMFIHGAKLAAGTYVNDMGTPITLSQHAFTDRISMYYAQINHYSVKSREEFSIKKTKGRADSADDHVDKFSDMTDDYFTRQDRNEDSDHTAMRFLEAVKQNLAVLSRICAPDHD